MSTNEVLPPALPPRKPSALQQPQEPISSTLPSDGEDSDSAMSTPPPLPPRGPRQIASSPLAPPLAFQAALPLQTETKAAPHIAPRPISVEITPATPQILSPVTPPSTTVTAASVTVAREIDYTVPEPPATATLPGPPIREELPEPPHTAPPYLTIPSSPPPAASSVPPPLPRRPTKAADSPLVVPLAIPESLPPVTTWIAVTVGVVILAYFRIVPLWLILLGVGGAGATVQAATVKVENEEDVRVLGKDRADMKHAVGWVNHLLYALFPLISTDVLTPFIDLLEDALIQQIPPIVTSVRLEAPALGSQPLLLTSLRAMSDEEWFASVSKPGPSSKTAAGTPEVKAHRKSVSGRHLGDMLKGSRRGKSDGVAAGPSEGMGRSRSASGSSLTSAVDVGDGRHEADKRRRRDRVLRRVKRTFKDHPTGDSPDSPTLISPLHHDDDIDADEEEDPQEAGQYVNFQIGFSYARPESTKHRKGYGLHVLGYFGIGVKGLGRTELPVYIDMLAIKGTINVRILLSATPPFASTATISFPRLPEFDISAKPLTRSTFNAMSLPGMKPYVQASIADVARTFVRPESYTLDVDRLLLGREAAFRTTSIGVLHIIIHSAEGLPKVDTMGTCDPYVAVGFAKYHKPMFSTRTIIDNQNPTWEEPAFVLVTSDEVESGESLRLRICDADRFSADDAVGIVEVELADLLDIASSSPHSDPIRRNDALKSDKPGMRVSGSLTWSVRFAPLWHLPPEEARRRVEEHRKLGKRKGDCDEAAPWWFDWVERVVGEKPEWVGERSERNKETAKWFLGEREKDEMEVMDKPAEGYRSGVLQFHIHQCVDLEVESIDGTYSASSSARKSAAGGRPALADLTDRTAAENPDPPSSYVEVHLNDRMVFRTRTKQVTPLPYFNAVSERFLRDWRSAKLVFVVRDERDREHDPILGIVTLRLEEAFKERSQFTRWYPLVGGLGWGRIRISLLWKPIDIHLPPRVSAFEIATLEIKSLAATDLSHLADKKGISVLLETEADKFVLGSDTSDTPTSNRNSLALSPSRPSTSSPRSPGFGPGSAGPPSPGIDGAAAEDGEMEWDITRPIRLAVEYRHSCSVLVSFITRHGVMRKKRVVGLASVRLNEVEDNTDLMRTVPIFATSSVKDAIVAGQAYAEVQANKDGVPLVRAPTREVPILGFVSLGLALRPGVSRAHRKLAKKDMRFNKVYEAWEADRDVRKELGVGRDTARIDEEDEGSSGEETDSDGEDEGAERRVKRTPSGRSVAGASAMSARSVGDEDSDEGFMSKSRAHQKALHKRHKGIFQLKIARTGKFVKDKIEAKLYARATDRRIRGADLDVEQEGQSRL